MYNSLAEAKESIEFLQENKWVKELSAYKCSVCGFWHLTSK
jgi:rubrerythrin